MMSEVEGEERGEERGGVGGAEADLGGGRRTRGGAEGDRGV